VTRLLLALLLCLPACAQQVAGIGAVGPNGSVIGRNGSTNWLYVPTDPSGNLFMNAAGFAGTPQVASTNKTGPLGSLIGYYAAGSEWLYVPVDANGNLYVNCVTGCGGGGGAVDSVFGRTGAVIAATNDYSFSQLSGQATNAQLATQTANTLLGSLTATTPSGIAVPACANGLTWTSGTGFGCVTPTPGTTTSSATFNNSGSGAASGATFNGAAAVTISRNTLGAAASGANGDITALTGLTTPLSTAQGGTGAGVLTGPRYANGSSADTVETSAQVQATIGNGVYLPPGPYYAGTATGAVNVLAATLNSGLGSPTQASLTGTIIGFTPNLANTTTTPTLNINGLGAVTIVKGTSTALAAGDIALNTPAFVTYNGTNWQLLNPQATITQASTSAASFFASLFQTPGGGGYENSTSTNNTNFIGGQNASTNATLGSAIVHGGNNSNSGASAGGGNALLEAGTAPSTGTQGFANVQQSFTIAAATTVGYVMQMTSTADRVVAAALGSTNNVGAATTVGGTAAQLYVATEGKTLTVFDGTPVVGDFACAPPASTGTVGLAHDNGTAACPTGQQLGIVTGQVSGTGSGATATVLLAINNPIALSGYQTAISTPNGTPTYTPGTGVTSVGCASGYTCTNTRGELTIVGGTATTGTIATLNFSTTLSAAPGLCQATQNGGTATYGIGHGVPSTSSFTITAGISVLSTTVNVDYECMP
jgi:hypothetical protein